MVIFTVLSLVSALILSSLGIFVFSRHPKSPLHIVFLLLSLAVSWWAFTEFMLRYAPTFSEAYFWMRMSSFWTFIPALALNFTWIFTRQNEIRSALWIYPVLYLPAILFCTLELATDLINRIPVLQSWGYAFGLADNLTIYYLEMAWGFGLMLLAFLGCVEYYLTVQDSRLKKQAEYIMIGVLFPSMAAFTGLIVIPAYNIRLLPVTTISAAEPVTICILFFSGFVWYGIWKHDLFVLTPATAADTILSTMTDLLVLLDRNGRIVTVNRATRTALLYEENELIGRPVSSILTGVFPGGPGLPENISREGGLLQDIEMTCRRKDGTEIPVSVSVSVVRDNEKELSGTVMVLRDITGRKRAEAALHESEEKFRSIVENANEIIFSLTLDGRFTYVSPNMDARLGYAAGEVMGKFSGLLVHPQDLPGNTEFFRQIIATGHPVSGHEYRIRHKDGTWLWHSQSLSPVRDRTGRVVAIQGMCHDITERKRAEEALLLANRQLNLLNSVTRHDINNNITAILGYLVIAEKKFPDPGLAAYLRKMGSATTAIRSQIEFTRLYQDLGTHEPHWIDLDSVLPRSEVPPSVSLAGSVEGTEVFASPMLERVFFNLLDNSLRHGGHVTEIRVSSHHEGSGLVVIWEDNGIGIAADEKEKIFERGFGRNTGLGMFLVREILSLTDIAIRETGEPGKGAHFEIVVPEGAFRFRRCMT